MEEDPEIVHYPGDLEFTPLLYACKHDRPEIARALLLKGADMMQFCDVGYGAIHAATRNGCSNIVDVLIEFGEKRGISGKDLIHTLDKEKNLPLHAAVNSGDLKAVLVCLKAGADISAPHAEDKQTSIHYGAAKGALGLIKAMFEDQPEKVENCVALRDVLDQTPLHKAAMFNHLDVVKYLLDKNSSINCQDEERRTPLVIAASKNATEVVNFLLSRRANVSMRDKDNRNFLHMAILTGTKLKGLEIKSLKTLKVLLNERDDFGCCPAHYAAKAGQLATLKGLLDLGAQVLIKDNEKKNAMHMACRYGRIHSVKSLVSSEYGKILLTEIDTEGHTALHIAAIYGQAQIIALMLRRGAQLNRDFELNTVLHMSAESGSYQAVALLLGLAPHLLNQQNRAGNTALHLAANNNHALVVDYLLSATGIEMVANADGASFFDLAIQRDHSDVVAAVIRHPICDQVMRLPSVFGLPIIGLIQHLPGMCLLILDKGMVYSTDSPKSDNFNIQYNFRYLITPERLRSRRFEKVGKSLPLWPLNMMVRFNRVECLAHPLCVTFLDQKWNSYGAVIYNFRLLAFVITLFLLTTMAFEADDSCAKYLERRKLAQQEGKEPDPNDSYTLDISQFGLLVRMLIVTIFSGFNLVLHILNIAQQKLAYIFDATNYIELAFYLSIMVFTLPTLIGLPSQSAQYITTALTLFFGWFNFLIQMQRFNFFGLYIVMFQEIFKSLIRALIVFTLVLIAFSLSMTLVFRRRSGRSIDYINPFQTFITILPMMWGDINYSDYVVPDFADVPEDATMAPWLTSIIFGCFILLMGILVKNILIGLAVGNIESVQKNARLKRLAMQVIYFTDLESRLPRSFLKKREVFVYKFFPNIKVNKFLESLKAIVGRSKGGSTEGSEEGFGDDQQTDKAGEREYIQEQLSMQGRRVATLVSRYEMHREMVKIIHQNLDTEICNDGKRAQREMESGDEDEDEHKTADDSGTVFRSAASNAQWHAINRRLSNLKNKPKTNIWVTQDQYYEDTQAANAQNSAVGNVL